MHVQQNVLIVSAVISRSDVTVSLSCSGSFVEQVYVLFYNANRYHGPRVGQHKSKPYIGWIASVLPLAQVQK